MRQKAFSILLVLCLSISLFSCGEVQQTNHSLTIFVPTKAWQEYLTNSVTRFSYDHPGVTVRFMELPDEPVLPAYDSDYEAYAEAVFRAQEQYKQELLNFYRSVRGEVMAGRGPDLLILTSGQFPNLYKAMASGIFADLKPLLEADADFHWDDYNTSVTAEGVYRDQQFLFPLFYNFQSLITTKKIQTAEGQLCPRPESFNLSHTGDLVSLFSEAAHLADQPGSPHAFYDEDPARRWIENSGLPLVDYETQSVSLDIPEFRSIQKSIATLKQHGQLSRPPVTFPAFQSFTEGKDYFLAVAGGNYLNTVTDLYRLGLEPQVFPVHSTNGGIEAQISSSAAIRANSENQANAADFLRLLLKDRFQSNENFHHLLPVRKLNLFDSLAYRKELEINSVGKVVLPEHYYDEYIEWAGEITGACFPTDLDHRIDELFTPYYEGRESYDDCLQRAQSQLRINISE